MQSLQTGRIVVKPSQSSGSGINCCPSLMDKRSFCSLVMSFIEPANIKYMLHYLYLEGEMNMNRNLN